jgi:hypothetical protein
LVKEKTTNIFIGKSYEDDLTKSQCQLGPGVYYKDLKKTQIGGKFGRGERDDDPIEREKKKVPGPGVYDVNKSTVTLTTNPGCALKSKNNHHVDNINKNLSNPGQYDPSFSLVKPRPQSCKFSN